MSNIVLASFIKNFLYYIFICNNKFQTSILIIMQNLFKSLLSNYMKQVDGLIAVAVCDRDGLIIASESKEGEDRDSVIGVISAILDGYIERIKQEFGTEGNFINITITGDKKFAFCSQGPNSILTTVAEPSTEDMELRVYSEHIASKVELLIEGTDNVSLEIPEIIRTLSKTKGGKLPTGEFSTKLIVCGDYQVGKTSLIRRFVENRFQENYISTIGVEISKKVMDLDDTTSVNFILWDIGGQRQQMIPYRKRFYNGANSAFLVIDRTRENNLKSIEFWYKEIKESTPNNIPIVIVGNKSDLIDDLVISEEKIKEVSEKFGFHYILTSAKTGENVNDAFMYIAYQFLENV
ncbi:MAG: GTP-binding protein [Candidatus Lokiarchaeota archaeon]|nr:GTP-binding protein [Candidatus Lokiarchaeota archaeon]